FFFDENRGMIGQSSRRGYLTTDGGLTWTQKEEAAAGAGYAYDAVNDALYSTTFESGNNGYLNRTQDQGESWQRVTQFCAAGGGVGVTPAGNFVYALGTGGHIQRLETDGLTNNRSVRRQSKKLNAFPNPTTGWLTVKIPATQGNTSLTVYAADGRSVTTIPVPANVDNLQLDLANQPPGLYLLNWQSAKGILHTGRIILK
ncbi:MAG: T9SS type A sorting domain-containing protein, partial [Bacteroidota bacterium]